MKHAAIVFAFVVLGVAAYFTASVVMDARVKSAQSAVQQAKLAKARADAEAKAAAEANDAKELEVSLAEKRTAQANAEKQAQREAAEADRAKYKADEAARARAAAETKLAETKKSQTVEEARLAEARRESEANARAKAEAELKAKEEGRRIAELALAREQTAAKRVADELKVQELKKQAYDELYEQTLLAKQAYEARLEELKPARTIRDLATTNGGDEPKDTGPVAGNSVSGRARTPQRVLREKMRTEADGAIDEQEEKLRRVAEDGEVVNAARITARLEALLTRALREKRMDDAEYYLANLKILVPDYVYEPAKK